LEALASLELGGDLRAVQASGNVGLSVIPFLWKISRTVKAQFLAFTEQKKASDQLVI
jgi:hypothetical protein